MLKILDKIKIPFLIALVTGLLVYFFADYTAKRFQVLEKSTFNEFKDQLSESFESGSISDVASLSSYIKTWAERSNLEYKEDASGNIIFTESGSGRKKDLRPSVFLVNMNSLSAADDISVISTAAMLASHKPDVGKRTVIFVNDDLCTGAGFESLSDKYISDDSDVMLLEREGKLGARTASFARTISDISIPVKIEDNTLDSAIKIHIGGISPEKIGPDIIDHPDPIDAVKIILNYLKSRSLDYRISDLQIESNGNMSASSLDLTVVINSYTVPAFSKRLDQLSKSWPKEYENDDLEIVFTYELIEDETALPGKCCNKESSDQLTSLIYGFNNGIYTFRNSDPIPEGYEEGDIYGYNFITGMEQEGSSYRFRIVSQGINDMFLNRIEIDNQAVADLVECKYSENESMPEFINEESKLLVNLQNTYNKVNDVTDSKEPKIRTSDRFTNCSYIFSINPKADIIQLGISNKGAAKICNTLLFFVNSKADLPSL